MSTYKIKEMPLQERPRERLKQVGLKNLSDKELLAIILKTGTKEKNVTDLALDILNKYSLAEMKDLSLSSLTSIKGIGEVKALELLSSIELGKRIFTAPKTPKPILKNASAIFSYTKDLFYNQKQELFYCLYFDTKQRLIGKKLLFMGTINQSITHTREVFKEAYKLSASSIICLHNHPSNDTTPSKDDILFTKALIKTGTIQGIPVVDHIIIGEDNYYSFYEHKDILNL